MCKEIKDPGWFISSYQRPEHSPSGNVSHSAYDKQVTLPPNSTDSYTPKDTTGC